MRQRRSRELNPLFFILLIMGAMFLTLWQIFDCYSWSNNEWSHGIISYTHSPGRGYMKISLGVVIQPALIPDVCRHQVTDLGDGVCVGARWPVVMQHTMAAGHCVFHVCVFDNHTFPRVVSSVSSPSSLLCLPQHPHLSSLLSRVTHCGRRPGLEGGTGWVRVGDGV